ncbi:hypothetical protein M9H77_31684 [Catharanthus roseus]|uniref:Uncharacterized protein n=1 Tax=Catharanthus roseus TaxID=4058 RepID=A0ACC0A3H1_CATRO|nr:hypothetical protein M9H77_31684 [Catharanthus roseus]
MDDSGCSIVELSWPWRKNSPFFLKPTPRSKVGGCGIFEWVKDPLCNWSKEIIFSLLKRLDEKKEELRKKEGELNGKEEELRKTYAALKKMAVVATISFVVGVINALIRVLSLPFVVPQCFISWFCMVH